MKRLPIVLLCVFALAALASWVPRADGFSDFGSNGTTDNCQECHDIFGAGPSDADHQAHSSAVGSGNCGVCHGGFPVELVNCVQCHLGEGLRAHHENSTFPGANSCGTQTVGCHTGDGTPAPENTIPPSYNMPPAVVALDPCDGSEERFASVTVSLDNDGDLLYDMADPDCLPAADLNMTKTASPEPVDVNNMLTYTLTVLNEGPNAANVTLDDTLPANVTFVSSSPSQGTCNPPVSGVISCDLGLLANGATATVTIVVMPTSTGSITNTAAFTGMGNDPDPSDNSDSALSTVNPPPGPSVDLMVMKSDSPDPVDINSTLTYTVTVMNNSSTDDATVVTLTDTLPTGVTFGSATPSQGTCSESSGVVTCDLGTILASGSATVTIDVTPTVGGNIDNMASVTGNESDPNTANNSVTESTTVNAPGISVTPTTNNFGTVAPGSTANTDFTIANNGDADLTVSSITLDDKVNFIVDLETGTCNASPITVTVDLDGAQAGTASTVTGSATVDYDLTTGALDWNITFGSFASMTTVSHFHGPAIPGVSAGVAQDIELTAGFTSPLIGSATITTSSQEEQDLLSGLWYINIHTADNPAGEIRGQVSGDISGTLVIAPSTSCTVNVVFTPQSTSQTSGTLTITSDDPDAPTTQVSLTGNRPAPPPPSSSSGCSIVGSKAPILQGTGAFILLLLVGGWYVIRRKKE